MKKKVGVLLTHPVQYFADFFRELSKATNLEVFFSHQQSPEDHAKTVIGTKFSWPKDITEGYDHRYLDNKAKEKNVNSFFGCNCPSIFKEIDRGKFDLFIVFGWHSFVYVQAILACKLSGTPVFVRSDSTLKEQRSLYKKVVKSLTYPILLRIPSGFFYVGKRNREFYQNYFVPPDRLYFSPHCVGDSRFFPGKTNRSPIRNLRIIKVLTVASLIPLQRVGDILIACKSLSDRGYDIRVSVVGSGVLLGELKKLAKELGLASTFHSFVNQDNLREHYLSTDLLVLGSESESWGLVVNEAMQCGLPVVVSDACGCSEDLVTEYTGEVFRVGDVKALANAIERVALNPLINSKAILDHISDYSAAKATQAIVNFLRGKE